LQSRGLPTDDATVDRVFAAAKAQDHLLTEQDVRALLAG
jgi:hypothetical protein